MADNQNTQPQGGPYTEQLPSNAKLFSILAYIGLLWLLGLLISPEKTSPFVRSHVNNGILLSIVCGIATAICWIPVVGWIIEGVVGVACCVFAIMGIIAAAKTQYYTIPLIGSKFKILK
ncbi:MAG: hypothetical protein K5665_02665 [Saccharofermentans sp.]|nr:hypothetical protein [Saccharofermentans sp.]